MQGHGAASEREGDEVSVSGVVTALFRNAMGPTGLFLQDPAGDADPGTSDGLFVFLGSGNPLLTPEIVRDRTVMVRGTVKEQSGLTELMDVTALTACEMGTIVPTTIGAAEIEARDLERFESMLMTIAEPMTVAETFLLARFGQVTVTLGEAPFTPTHSHVPGSSAVLAQDVLNRRRRLVLDDGSSGALPSPIPFVGVDGTVRVGDTVTGLTGVLDYGSVATNANIRDFRLHPISPPSFARTDPRPATPPAVGGDTRVVSMNVLNYFTTLDANPGQNNGPNICGPGGDLECRGANTPQELERQRQKIVKVLQGLDADVVGLLEIQNDDGATVQHLLAAVNATAGTKPYAFVDTGTIGADAIKVAIIYRPSVVTPIGSHAILDSTVDPRFRDMLNRPSVAQTFERAGGGRFTVVVNHLKSKGSPCDSVDDPDTGDGSGNCNQTRTLAAEALVDWIATDPTRSGDPDVLVVGDMNAYVREQPIQVFRTAGYANLIETFVGPEAYSFVFDAQKGYLDHALASPSLVSQVTGAGEWHINAAEPNAIDFNTDLKGQDLFTDSPYRASDHDPLIVGLNLLGSEE